MHLAGGAKRSTITISTKSYKDTKGKHVTEPAKPTVLIIDDDETISGAMSRALTLAGYEISVAATGKTGLERAFETHPDLVILDYTIPGTDGLQVLDKLRADM